MTSCRRAAAAYSRFPAPSPAPSLLKRRERKLVGLLCKATCFILLFLSFLMVLVTVSIFLSKGIKNEE